MSGALLPEATSRWYASRTFWETPSLARVVDLKRSGGFRISVCLPALNEAPTVGLICRSIVDRLMGRTGLVDDLVVIDSGSEDGTIDVAREAGATVHRADDILRERMGPGLGKGDALWRSLAVIEGDIVVWLDSDTRNFDPSFVSNLVAPLLGDDDLLLVKAFYDRPLGEGPSMLMTGGARVTELVVRPLLNMFYPQLAGLIQPLSGEYAIRTQTARSLPFFTGYGVEIGLLIDLVENMGLDALAQADLGRRVHRNQEVLGLGRMAHQVLQVMLRRFDEIGILKLEGDVSPALVQFVSSAKGAAVEGHTLPVLERPPMTQLT